jgi:selenide,water dikinase
MIAGLSGLASPGGAAAVLVGPETGDDAGVFQLGEHALVATADFITPVCDEPFRFGRVAAANSLSDVYAMGGQPLFALNLCFFPPAAAGVPAGVLQEVLAGAAAALREAGAALLGGHTVEDAELKFGLAVVGQADPRRLLTLAGARPAQRLLLTKPLGTGVLINAHKQGKLDAAGLEPALREMERLNSEASRLALAHGVTAATDITGFGLAGHALNMARASQVGLRIEYDRLPVHDGFHRLAASGVGTGSTAPNRRHVAPHLGGRSGRAAGLSDLDQLILFDPQTSGGLLLATPAGDARDLLAALLASGHRAADIGEVLDGPPRLDLV